MTVGGDKLLRRSLTANGFFSAGFGVAAVGFTGPIARFMGISEAVLMMVGIGLLLFGFAAVWNSNRSRIDLRLARLTVAADLTWVAASAILISGFPNLMTSGGKWLLAVLSAVVLVFGGLQWRGIRRVVGPKRLSATIDIEAKPGEVWGVLTDLETYEEWNPHIPDGRGAPVIGETIELRMVAGGDRRMTMKPTVTEAIPGEAFEWLGHLGIRGVFDGRHRFDLEPVSGGTRLTQSEEFTGFLVPLLSGMLDTSTRPGFEAMNLALKERVESIEN